MVLTLRTIVLVTQNYIHILVFPSCNKSRIVDNRKLALVNELINKTEQTLIRIYAINDNLYDLY